MKVEGQCHCGQVTYRAAVDPERVTLCHCTDCQMLSGSAYRVSVPAPSEGFTLLTGRLKIYVKTAESGARRAHAFCPDCATPVYSSVVDNPPSYSLRVGCLRERNELPPRKRIWCQSALGWSSNIDEIPQFNRQNVHAGR